MEWYRLIAFASLLLCLASLTSHFVKLVRLGMPKDFSRQRGNVTSAIAYSFLGAISPTKKESAYLHLPTYMAGILYHLGTFISFVCFFLILLHIPLNGYVAGALVGFLAVTALCGIGILVKRIIIRKLRLLSNPDDYISNLVVTMFQLSTLIVLVSESFAPVYFLCVAILLLYLPMGKLKHVLYFFAARYHLGFFYGWRGIWPSTKS